MIEIKYPTYKVITPQTKLEIEIQSMTIMDENKLKTSVTDTKGLTQLLNRLIYDKIENKDTLFESYDDYKNKITIKDRDALISGLYHASYGDEFIPSSNCPSCGFLNENKITISEIGRVKYYEGEPQEILQEEIEITLPVSKLTVTIGVPTISDEEKHFDIINTNDPTFVYITFLHTKKIVSDGITLTIDENTYDLLSLLQSLPVKDRKYIDKQIDENFNQYGVTLPYKVICSKCKSEYVSYVNFLEELFRMALEP